MATFKEFVEENSRWFAGRGHETEESISAAERELGVVVPSEIRWLLKEYGYWHATGICSLEDTIADTIAARDHPGLPQKFIVLYNHQDGGAILLDTEADDVSGNHSVYNVDWSDIPDQIAANGIRFESYMAYTVGRLQLERDFVDPAHIDCPD